MSVRVNDVVVDADAAPSLEFAVVHELLRQRAVAVGLLDEDASDEEAVGAGIERLLAREVRVPTPTESECRRYYEAHRNDFRSDDLIHARHILFQVTPQVNVTDIRARAERVLVELVAEPDRFAERARELSNCPSGSWGGNLGQLGRGDSVPEFEQVVFRLGPIGIVPELVKTRFGFHIVAVDQRIPGADLPFEAVVEKVAKRLQAAVEERALRQYVALLAGQAEIVGVDIEAATTPLVQ